MYTTGNLQPVKQEVCETTLPCKIFITTESWLTVDKVIAIIARLIFLAYPVHGIRRLCLSSIYNVTFVHDVVCLSVTQCSCLNNELSL